MSRRSHEATSESRRQVMTLAGFGIQQDEIATLLRVDAKTLRKHYRHELDVGSIEANARVIAGLYSNATKNMNVAAQIWWTKCRAGWRETEPNAATGTHFEFSWKADPEPPPAPRSVREAPIIDAAVADADDGAVVVWQGGED